MTKEQKDILISKMLECPAELSDTEITQILADDELRDIYSISVDIKAAKENLVEIDASMEWNRFRSKLVKPRRWNIRLFTRVAAILVGALLVSAGLLFLTTREKTDDVPLYSQNDKPDNKDSKETESTTAVDEKEPESQVMQRQPRRPRKPMLAQSSKPQNVEDQLSVDVEEYVRIQQARMDNDLAMQRAEAVVNRYYAMADIDEAMYSSIGDEYVMEDEIVTLIIP